MTKKSIYSKLYPLFYPKSIAVIGASEKPGSLGRAIMRNLLNIKFPGKIYPINIKGEKCFGLPMYRSILDVKDTIDLAVILVPASVVPKIMEDCSKKGVKTAIIISAGFSEVGEDGKKLEEEVHRIAQKGNVRVLGPNCLGIYNPRSKVDLIFNPPDRQQKPGPGDIAFLSQSGAFGAAILDFMAEEEIGISSFVSYGNAMDITESTLLQYFSEDPETSVITMYIEGIKNGRIFSEVAREVVTKKPIVVLKAGRTEAGAKAAKSHTGSLAGSDTIYDGVFRQLGIIRANSMLDLFTKAKALAYQPPAKGNRIAIVTNGGGVGVMAADAIELEGMQVASLTDSTINQLKNVLPPHASPYNPIDIIGDADYLRYKNATEIALRDPNVDALIILIIPQSPALDHKKLVEELVSVIKSQRKPVTVAIPGGKISKILSLEFEKHRIPTYKTPEDAVMAMKALVTYGTYLQKRQQHEN
ncbi:MAG: acetate--CoA ligase family protein [Candidatus Asgardarchaeia archaeon]